MSLNEKSDKHSVNRNPNWFILKLRVGEATFKNCSIALPEGPVQIFLTY